MKVNLAEKMTDAQSEQHCFVTVSTLLHNKNDYFGSCSHLLVGYYY